MPSPARRIWLLLVSTALILAVLYLGYNLGLGAPSTDKNLATIEEAWNHWNSHGKKEERIYADIPIFFNWKDYIINNNDLSHTSTEETAWKHFLYHSRKEKRFIKNKDYLKKYRI